MVHLVNLLASFEGSRAHPRDWETDKTGKLLSRLGHGVMSLSYAVLEARLTGVMFLSFLEACHARSFGSHARKGVVLAFLLSMRSKPCLRVLFQNR